MKPVMYVANVEEDGFENNALLEEVKAVGVEEKAPVVAVCAKIEAEISDLPDEEKQIFLEDIGMHEPGLNMVEKERMQPFWYQGNLIDPNEELPFPLEQLEAENAWNDMWDAMTEEEQDAYMKAEFGTEQ